uniref:Uncharacterized protein n=1 Tax=Anguilla anguilla TaxID=7936 RepID=A0A0E9WAX7_ANGAN
MWHHRRVKSVDGLWLKLKDGCEVHLRTAGLVMQCMVYWHLLFAALSLFALPVTTCYQ